MTDRTRHIVAFYDIDRAYGGPEEGGWWFDTGALRRVVPDADAACALAARANRLMERLQRGRRSVESVAYDGGRLAACVFQDTAPPAFPETYPHYE